MIVKSMTSNETLDRVKRYENWVGERVTGIYKKFKKQIMNKFIPDGSILGVSNYTIENDKCTSVWVKSVSGKVSSFWFCTMYETEIGYIIPICDRITCRTIGYFRFTQHSVQRMKERLGVDMYGFFIEHYLGKNRTAHHLEKYDFNNNPNEYICQMGDAFLIVDMSDGKELIVKTVLDKDTLYAHQLKQFLNSKIEREKMDIVANEVAEEMKSDYFEKNKIKDTRDLYKRIVA